MNNRYPDDPALVERVKRGDQKALKELMGQHGPAVFSLTTRLLGGDRAWAEEVFQEAWHKAVRSLEGFEGRGNFRSWVMTIARHLAISELRKRRESLSFDEDGELDAVDERNPEDEVIRESNIQMVREALDKLPDNQRIPLILFVVEDLSQEEIASRLSTTVANVKTMIFRGKQTLIRRLSKR